MDCQSAAATSLSLPLLIDDRDVHRLAAQTWLALQAADVPPTPQNFELWFTHLGGTNPELTRRMEEMLKHKHRPVREVLELIYTECISASGKSPLEGLEDGAEELEEVARDTASQVEDGRRYLSEYGSALSSAGSQLDGVQSIDSLVNTVAVLVAETTRASERNRILEARLNASANRVQRLRSSLAELKHDSTTDQLTGLHSWRGFDARLRRAITSSKLENTPLCLMLVDIDRFREFNDTYGNKTGDLVLRLIARLLSENIKGKDVAARYGGDEFAVILSGADETAGSKVAEQLRVALGGKRLINRSSGQQILGVTISIGVAALLPNERFAALIDRAAAALFQAKQSGRNSVCGSSALSEIPSS